MAQSQPTKVKKKKKSVLKRTAQARQRVHAHERATYNAALGRVGKKPTWTVSGHIRS